MSKMNPIDEVALRARMAWREAWDAAAKREETTWSGPSSEWMAADEAVSEYRSKTDPSQYELELLDSDHIYRVNIQEMLSTLVGVVNRLVKNADLK